MEWNALEFKKNALIDVIEVLVPLGFQYNGYSNMRNLFQNTFKSQG